MLQVTSLIPGLPIFGAGPGDEAKVTLLGLPFNRNMLPLFLMKKHSSSSVYRIAGYFGGH